MSGLPLCEWAHLTKYMGRAILGEFLLILLIGSFIIWLSQEEAAILIFQVSFKSSFFHLRSDHVHESLDEKVN